MARRIPVVKLLVIAAIAMMAGSLAAETEGDVSYPDYVGPEFSVDGPKAVQPGTSRIHPGVAVDNSGRRIHVWEAFGEVDRTDIFMRRFDAAGNPLEDPQQVNTTTEDDQEFPEVAVSGDGSFLVIFDSDEPHAVGADRDVLRSQAYDANGDAVGGEQLLSAAPTPGRLDLQADVAALRTADGTAGGYAVVWASYDSSGTDTSWGLEACLVSATGVPGQQFQVPSDPDGSQDSPSVTELTDGGFLVTWTESSQIWGRRFNAAGGPVGNDFVISTSFVAQKLANDAAIGWDGRVIVVWAEQEDNGGTREIYARLYDPDLNPLGPDFRVNTVVDSDESDPRAADLGPEGFLVVWQSPVSSGDDPAGSVESRLVTGPNQFGSPQEQFNVWGNAGQQFPGAHGWYGRAGVNWRSSTTGIEPIPDPNTDDHIIGRDVDNCIYCDDFEWFHPGGTESLWRWAKTVGVSP